MYWVTVDQSKDEFLAVSCVTPLLLLLLRLLLVLLPLLLLLYIVLRRCACNVRTQHCECAFMNSFSFDTKTSLLYAWVKCD